MTHTMTNSFGHLKNPSLAGSKLPETTTPPPFYDARKSNNLMINIKINMSFSLFSYQKWWGEKDKKEEKRIESIFSQTVVCLFMVCFWTKQSLGICSVNVDNSWARSPYGKWLLIIPFLMAYDKLPRLTDWFPECSCCPHQCCTI